MIPQAPPALSNLFHAHPPDFARQPRPPNGRLGGRQHGNRVVRML